MNEMNTAELLEALADADARLAAARALAEDDRRSHEHEMRVLTARRTALAARLAAVEALADEWERRAGMQSEAWRVFGPQTVSVPHAVESIRAALHPNPSQESA